MPKIIEKVVVSRSVDKVKINFDAIPKHEKDALCRDLIFSVTEAFKNPETVAEFETWLIKRYGKREGKRLFKQEVLCTP